MLLLPFPTAIIFPKALTARLTSVIINQNKKAERNVDKMKLRPPAIPLITVDPYFSVWSVNDRLNEGTTRHWTGSPNTIEGTVTVNGKEYVFMGDAGTREKMPK